MLSQSLLTVFERSVAIKASAAMCGVEPSEAPSGPASRCVVDLISAIVAHAEAIPRWLSLAGRSEPEACELAHQIVTEVLRVHVLLKSRERPFGDATRGAGHAGDLERLRKAAERLLRLLRGAGEDEPSFQDASQIAINIHNLGSMVTATAAVAPCAGRDARLAGAEAKQRRRNAMERDRPGQAGRRGWRTP